MHRMEPFIPQLLVFLVAVVVTFLIAPRATPLIATIASIGFVAYGVYDHYSMFESEYRLSTWHEGLRVYAPVIMLLAVLVFILMSILAFFTGGKVPVPAAMSLPNMNAMANNMGNMMNNLTNTMTNTVNHAVNTVNDAVNNTAKLANQAIPSLRPNNKNGVSRSFLETI